MKRQPTGSVPSIAGFRIIRQIGRGGMGVVYEAEEEVLCRRVALKVLPENALHRERMVQRFEREAKAAARLHHSNIVPVFGVGHHDGFHYYVMQYIDGLGLDAVINELKTLRQTAPAPAQSTISAPLTGQFEPDPDGRVGFDENCRERALEMARSLATGELAGLAACSIQDTATPAGSGETLIFPPPPEAAPNRIPIESSAPVASGSSGLSTQSDLAGPYFHNLARIGLQAADALGYANRHGVLHRDVKPSNLLLDRLGNVWLADFGLAKTEEADDLTKSGDIVGTLRYMAPERFGGQCDARSDIYSLGLTLYELVALRPALAEPDRFKLIQQIQHSEPPRLRTLAPKVPRDLETIIHKAAMREPARRYATAGALADDLRRFLEGRPIKARQASRPELLALWLKRNPWVAAFLAALLFGLFASVWQLVRATRAERAARLAELATRKERDRAAGETKKAKQSEAEARAVLDFFQNKIMAAVRPEGQEGGLGSEVKLRAAVDAAERGIGKSFAGQPAVEASIRHTLGESYYYQGAHKQAIAQYQRALALRHHVLGLDHPETIASANSLAVAYLDTGRLAEAIGLLEEALKHCNAKVGPDDPITMVTMGNLAHAYASAGRLADAIPLHEETLKRLESKFGRDHMHTLTARNNLADAYRNAGRLAEALPQFEMVLKQLRQSPGPDHPNTLLSMLNLGLAYIDAGRIEDAVTLFHEALKRCEAQLGLDHPDTLFARDCLARAYEAAHRLADVRTLAQETLRRRMAKLGPDNPETNESRDYLARILLALDPAAAEPLLRQALAIRIKTSPDAWTTSDTERLLGTSLLAQKKYAEAEEHLLHGYHGLVAGTAKISASAAHHAAETIECIVRLYEAWGKKEKAEMWRNKRPTAGSGVETKK